MQPLMQNAAEVVDLTVDDHEDELTVVPLTCSRMESQTTSTCNHNNSDSSASEQASDTASTVTSSQAYTVSEMSALLQAIV